MITHSAPNTNYLSSCFAFDALCGAQTLGTLMDMEIGEVIRQIRKARGLTLEEVAGLVEADTGNLSRVERGLQNHTPEMIDKLAKVFGVKVSAMYAIAEGADLPALLTYTPDQQQVLTLWEWLSPKQQAEWKEKMEAEAASNRELYEKMSAKQPPKRPASAVSGGPPTGREKKPHQQQKKET